MGIVYVGADHRGYQLKSQVALQLGEWEYEVKDVGAKIYDPEDDFSEIAFKLAEKVAQEKGRGILICGSGIGVAIAANKVPGIRAGLCMNEKQAQLARTDDDINILCLSADLCDEELNMAIIRTFLETTFSSEERFIRRIKKIKTYES
ncbi:RpiB/LacA/LacB family sugar-phosphate isomerase [Patescibacteria group bacterium]|nr:RpiB/LacA/LacB family sugar-phosphate isomerase [Patescibacteria group bacterium]